MSTLEILELFFLFVIWGFVVYLVGDKPFFRGVRLIATLALVVSIAVYGTLNYFEGRQEVFECLQTNETEC